MTKKRLSVSENVIEGFCQLVSDAMGLYFPKASWDGFEKKIMLVTQAFGFSDPSKCLEWLVKAPLTKDQIALLAHHLTVGETYFFRDHHAFDCLAQKVLPDLINSRIGKNQVLRIWSAACCTGEEPYSLAILIRELIPDLQNWKISILGSDLNPKFLHKAEIGRYKEWSFRATPDVIKHKYFVEEGGVYRLKDEIKKMVKFIYLNLVEDCYPSLINETNAMDLILCNNVLIYFPLSQIQKTIKHLSSALIEGGRLIVTPIETPYVSDSRLISLKFKDSTYFIKSNENNLNAPIKSYLASPQKANDSLSPENVQANKGAFKVELPAFLNLANATLEFDFQTSTQKETYTPPHQNPLTTISVKRNEDLLKHCSALYEEGNYNEVSSQLEAFLSVIKQENLVNVLKEMVLLSRSCANLGKLDQAKRWCETALQVEKLDPSIHFLHATILQELECFSEAISALKRALYLDQNFVMAHFAMANLLNRQGKHNRSLSHYRNALQVLQSYKSEDLLPGEEKMSAGRLSEIISNMQIVDRGDRE